MTRRTESDATRWSLIERLKNWDDNTSWKEFFETYWRLIYRTATRAGLADNEAEEVVQETVLSVAKKMGEFKADPALGSFKGWLLLITRRRVVDQFRKRIPEEKPKPRNPDETGTDVMEKIPDPLGHQWEKLWEEEWEQNLLDAALDHVKERVNPKHYKIFYLHVIKKLPAGKVSEAMDVNIAQVYIVKQRITALLKKEIKRLERQLK